LMERIGVRWISHNANMTSSEREERRREVRNHTKDGPRSISRKVREGVKEHYGKIAQRIYQSKTPPSSIAVNRSARILPLLCRRALFDEMFQYFPERIQNFCI